ncbi:peptidoglycan hydrolase-like protein with peptidoglycan-binding domain [Streptosporangium album]|uniref:Peptidoglycan hydrolase-like protein with peptidoglycan-binding domain n=1 Tax=Streptosporangium album TaxID=47479 RepID=A0A7W7W990_9ACTN|nr:peptidoglycan-binding protein [Streptosporangium album]MBB4938728.1 peptidoglycan hydrolase-like protein with peptidoglycan-binding domain [Streptosporangium album]
MTDGTAVRDGEPVEGLRPRRRKRRGGRIAVAAVVVAAGGAVAAASLGLGGGSPADGTVESRLPPKTAEVTRKTLTEAQSADGELGYGPATAVAGRLPGTLTRLPGTGDRITRGRALYEVDDRPVTLMYGSMPAYRALEQGIEGPDVKQLERNLKALGYSGFTVDEDYTYATAEAVMRWQEDRGLEETGVVELGRVVFVPHAVRVDALQAEKGDPTAPGRKILSYTGTTRAVTTELDTADQGLVKKGAKVTVTLPDDTTINGRIDEVSTVIKPGSGPNDDPATKVEVVVELTGKKAQQAAGAYTLASVDVSFTAGTRKNVLTVPVAALLALQEGGFGVEVVTGSTSAYVPVKTGLFTGGQVEVSGDGIAEGAIVGMPG